MAIELSVYIFIELLATRWNMVAVWNSKNLVQCLHWCTLFRAFLSCPMAALQLCVECVTRV